MHFYSIHVIAEYNLSGTEIICRQIHLELPVNLKKSFIFTELQWVYHVDS